MTSQGNVVSVRQTELAEICERFGVRRLYLFGSAATGHFRRESSDLDFVVEMADRRPTGAYADRFLGLADALERLFERPVDLVSESSLRNPYFRQELEATRQLVYEQPREETPV